MKASASAAVGTLLLLLLSGCGGKSAKVSGRVTCNGKPVVGSILFSPFGEGPSNSGEAVAVPLKADGSFDLQLKSTGKHRVVVSPSDVVYPAKPGKEYPCDLAPLEREIKAGVNDITIELPSRKR